ncbi:MAG TPA: hypothetical protein VGR27_07040 [Longimicrobiaceae bacterium]|nr:hypothetical protein [Longimicrobiaceae bacterium]
MTTYYARLGSGEPILVLGSGEARDSLGSFLLVPLAARFRVIAPEPLVEDGKATLMLPGSAGAPAFSSWLRDFLDGLGVEQVSIVAEGKLAIPSLCFTLSDPGRVERLVLLYPDAPGPLPVESVIGEVLHPSETPLLVLRVGGEAGDPSSPLGPQLCEVVIQFLSGEAEGIPQAGRGAA